jgi:hypothetical protein
LELLNKVKPSEAFIPNAKQEEFMLAVGRGESRHYALLGGNGSGKTAVLVNTMLQIMLGQHGWLSGVAGLPLFANWPYPKVAWLLGTHSNLKEAGSIFDNIKKYFPPGRYESEKQGREYNSVYRLPGYNWVIRAWSYDQDPEQVEGPTIGLAVSDEPMPEGFRGPVFSRLRAGGIYIAGMTPLDGAPWVIDIKETGHKDWYFVDVDVEDACKTHGVRGHLEHDEIEKMIESFPEYEREARKTGKSLSYSGRVYPDWGEGNLVEKDAERVSWELLNAKDPPTVYMVLDPHDTKPWVMTWWAVYRDGRKVCFMEWPDASQPMYHETDHVAFGYDYYAELIRRKERNLRVYKRLIDERYGFRRVMAGHGVTSIAREIRLASRGELNFVPSCGLEEDNRNLVQQAILPRRMFEEGDSILSLEPTLLADRGCKNFHYAMTHHVWRRNTGKSLDTSPRFQRAVSEKNKCFPNTAEYFLGFNPRWREPAIWLESDLEGLEPARAVSSGGRSWGGYSN